MIFYKILYVKAPGKLFMLSIRKLVTGQVIIARRFCCRPRRRMHTADSNPFVHLQYNVRTVPHSSYNAFNAIDGNNTRDSDIIHVYRVIQNKNVLPWKSQCLENSLHKYLCINSIAQKCAAFSCIHLKQTLNWRKPKLHERISQLYKRLILILK